MSRSTDSDPTRQPWHRSDAVEICTFCPKLCRFACPVAEAECRETVTPWGLMTRLDDLKRGGGQLDSEFGELLTHCTACGRCTEICKHSVDVPGTLLSARASADRLGVLPTALRDWALDAPACPPSWRALPVEGPTRLLPGRADEAEVVAALALLAAAGYPSIGRLDGPPDAGARLVAAGRPGAADGRARAVADAADGVRLICLDASDLNRLRPLLGAGCSHLIEALDGRLSGLKRAVEGEVLYLDSCRVGRGAGLYDGPRRLLGDVVGGVREAVMNRAEGGCCGAGAGYAVTAPRDAALAAIAAMEDAPDLPVVIADCECAAHLVASSGRTVHTWAQLVARGLTEEQKP